MIKKNQKIKDKLRGRTGETWRKTQREEREKEMKKKNYSL